MKKKASKKKPLTEKKPRLKTPDYIVINGVTYEKMSKDSVNFELDLQEDVLTHIDSLISSGKFVSRGDAIRTILRNKLDELDKK